MDKLRPCDCKDAVDTGKLEDQGIGHNDESIVVIPNYVLLKMGHTEIKISMSRFKMFAEWYLTAQDIKQIKWECYNAFKENGRIYVFGDRITNAEYEKISARNKRWFFKINIITYGTDEI